MNILLPIIVHAHEAATPHVEEPAQINPVVAIGALVVVALGGFLLWKFVLNTHAPSPQNDILPGLKSRVSPLKENVLSASIHPEPDSGILEASNKAESPSQVPNPTSTATNQQHTETKPE